MLHSAVKQECSQLISNTGSY